MTRRLKSLLSTMITGAIVFAGGDSVLAAFHSQLIKSFAASATTSGTAGVPTILTITAQPLPPLQAFPDKPFIVPVTITNTAGPLTTTNLQVDVEYQLLDANGSPLAPFNQAAITFVPLISGQNSVKGSAILPASLFQGVPTGGQLDYYFVASINGQATTLSKAGVSRGPANTPPPNAANQFTVSLIRSLTGSVGPQGSVVAVPDMSVGDGHTAVSFAPGALTNVGQLTIQDETVSTIAGPQGAAPVVAYLLTLQGTSLQTEAQLALSYPAALNGQVAGSNANPLDLAVYWFDGAQWRLLGRPQIDTTLHTVTVVTTNLGEVALFATGPVGAADIRPMQRIITPNGDGINDTISFLGLADNEDVHLFDVRGRRVRTLSGPSKIWDGKDDNGRIVLSGVYIYQYTSQGQRVSGVIMVAK